MAVMMKSYQVLRGIICFIFVKMVYITQLTSAPKFRNQIITFMTRPRSFSLRFKEDSLGSLLITVAGHIVVVLGKYERGLFRYQDSQ
jgi:hypothetical protein